MPAPTIQHDGSHTSPLESKPEIKTLKNLLLAKDDNSRFVGLALLKATLDNGELAQQSAQVYLLWDSISPKFFDRLLQARQYKNIEEAEARNMIDLAASVLHAFTILLPESAKQEKRFLGRAKPLVRAVCRSSSDTTLLLLQILLTIVSCPEGALEMLKIEDLSTLLAISTQQTLVFDILELMWMNAAISSLAIKSLRDSIDKIILELLHVFEKTNAVTLLSFLGSILPKMAPAVLSSNPEWLAPAITIMKKLVHQRPISASRAAYTQLASVLLQIYPKTSPHLLFGSQASSDPDTKPFSYLFVNLLLIDIRASFSTLLSRLNSPDYPALSNRLAAAFDIITSYIGFLLRTLDEPALDSSNIAPDLLLKLRKNVSETMSLSIEYLRDRWDASTAGAFGLDVSARTEAVSSTLGSRLTLTWDSTTNELFTDPLILAEFRALAIWIREDEGTVLRKEGAGIMDMLVEFYRKTKADTSGSVYPLLLALEGIMAIDEGVESFLAQDGWGVFTEDLISILKCLSSESTGTQSQSEARRGIEVVRVLLILVDHPSTTFIEETWLEFIYTATSMKVSSDLTNITVIEFQVSVLQFAVALLSKASVHKQKRCIASIAPLAELATQLAKTVNGLPATVNATELDITLDDVLLSLENTLHTAGQ